MSRIEFDKNLETKVNLGDGLEKVRLVISDDLDAAYQPLPLEYEKRIIEFLSKVDQWLPMVEERINSEFSAEVGSQLMQVFILSEPAEDDLIFGLGFRVEEDIEHGRGAKVSMNDLSIIAYGLADIAFC